MVQNVEHRVFTPLVFSTTGSIGKEGTTFYKRLADMLSRTQERPYSVVMGWMRCRLSFAILRSAIMCIRGTRSTFGQAINERTLNYMYIDRFTSVICIALHCILDNIFCTVLRVNIRVFLSFKKTKNTCISASRVYVRPNHAAGRVDTQAGYAKDAIVAACHRTTDGQEHTIIWRAEPEQDTIFH